MPNSETDETVKPPVKVIFEGMTLTQAEVEAIQARRVAAQDIKDGIDIEHINSWDDFIRTFKIALGRAERTRILDQSIGHHD